MSALRGLATATREALIWLAALGGLTCLVLATVGGSLGFDIVLFKTGSMSPTIPAGSAALVRQISADTVTVGDVVTVERPGVLPVTHRVIAVDTPADPGSHDERVLTLQGDANLAPDASPYRVGQVHRVLWSVPGVADTIAWLSSPVVLAPLTLAATFLVVWGMWPRHRHRHRHRHQTEQSAASSPAAARGAHA